MAYRKELAAMDGGELQVTCRAEKWGFARGEPVLCVTDLFASVTEAETRHGVTARRCFEVDHLWLSGFEREEVRPGDWIVFSGDVYGYLQDDASGARKLGHSIRPYEWAHCFRPPHPKPPSTAYFWAGALGLARLLVGIDKHPYTVLVKRPRYLPLYDEVQFNPETGEQRWVRGERRVEVDASALVDWHTYKRILPKPARDALYGELQRCGRLSDFLFSHDEFTPPVESWVSITTTRQ